MNEYEYGNYLYGIQEYGYGTNAIIRAILHTLRNTNSLDLVFNNLHYRTEQELGRGISDKDFKYAINRIMVGLTEQVN